MTDAVTAWVRTQYPDSKSNFMTCFMERAQNLVLSWNLGVINLPSWLFLSTFEKPRKAIWQVRASASLDQLGRGMFGSDFGSVTFLFKTKEANF